MFQLMLFKRPLVALRPTRSQLLIKTLHSCNVGQLDSHITRYGQAKEI